MNNEYKAIVTSDSNYDYTKSNGKKASLHSCQIEDGALKGMNVTGSRTQGEDKAPIVVGEEVTLYLTISSDSRGKKAFFEIGLPGTSFATDSEILEALGEQ